MYEPVAEWSKALHYAVMYYVQVFISFCGVGSNKGISIYFILFKPLSHFAYGYSLILDCLLKIKFAFISVRKRLTMYHCTSMRTHVWYMCHVCRCARIIQIHIPMIAEVKVFQR